jgi:hypothetical protein
LTNIIDGRAFAQELKEKVADYVNALKLDKGIIPGLAVVIVGDDPASHVYVRSKGKQTIEVGMKSVEHKLTDDTSEDILLGLIKKLNNDKYINKVSFDKNELQSILQIYGKMVSLGEWRDYSISSSFSQAIFCVFKRTSEQPLYMIIKAPKLRKKIDCTLLSH